jgi:hypothetical protein
MCVSGGGLIPSGAQNFLAPHSEWPFGVHPTSQIGDVAWEQSKQDVKLMTYLFLRLGLRKHKALPPIPSTSTWHFSLFPCRQFHIKLHRKKFLFLNFMQIWDICHSHSRSIGSHKIDFHGFYFVGLSLESAEAIEVW